MCGRSAIGSETNDVIQERVDAMTTTDADFDVTQRTKDVVLVVTVRGEIDVASAPRLREALSVAGAGTDLCIVDLSAVTFVDSTALGVLIEAAQACRSAGRDLRLVVTDPHIAKVFAITGLDDVFSIYADGAAAAVRR